MVTYIESSFVLNVREMLELAVSIKYQRPIGAELLDLTKLLIAKEKELKETLKEAEEQAKIQEQINMLQSEVDRQDQYIKQFERQIKDAQQILVSSARFVKICLVLFVRCS